MAHRSRRSDEIDVQVLPAGKRRLVATVLVRAAISAAGLVALYYVVPLGSFSKGLSILVLVGSMAGVVVLLAWQVRAILRSEYPGLEAVETVAMVIPLFLIVFAATYYVMDMHAASSFSQRLSRTDALYFTVTTFSTVGYGDITPVTETARAVVMLQMIGDLGLIGFGAKVLLSAVELRRKERSLGGPVSSNTVTDAGSVRTSTQHADASRHQYAEGIPPSTGKT